MAKIKARNWMIRSYREDGGKEKPIPKAQFDLIKAKEPKKKAVKKDAD